MWEVVVLGVGLAMDAATVSISIGCSNAKLSRKKDFMICFTFGIFQMLMPLIGIAIGEIVYEKLITFSKLIMFAIFAILGGKTLIEGLKKDTECTIYQEITMGLLISLGIATSIDALAAGLAITMMNVNYFQAALVIGVVTYIICYFALKLGKMFGCHIKNYAEIIGGVLLLLLAIKSLV